MKVTFKNLGPIEEATLDLSKRLTVLVGKNNTGKTFLASAAYAVSHWRTAATARHALILRLVEEAVADGSNQISRARFDEQASAYADAWSADVQESLSECMAVPRDGTVEARVHFGTDTVPQETKSPFLLAMGIDLTLGANGTFASWRPVRDMPALAQPNDIAQAVVTWIARGKSDDVSFQPAERLGIQVFVRELAAKRFEGISATYPWPISDSLAERLRDQTQLQPHALADQLETALLQGKTTVDAKGEFRFAMEGHSDSLSLHQVSSSVKSIAPISNGLRQWRPGRVFLDEPEMSLHPDLQRKFARWLGRAVGEGQQFLIATHSDYIVRELSHLLMMHNASPGMRKVMEENGYTPEEAIDPAHIEVLRLGEGRATPVEVDRHGFRVDTIDDELERISALSQDLFAVLDEPVEDASGE